MLLSTASTTITCLLSFQLFNSALAEIALVGQSLIDSLNSQPVRIVNGAFVLSTSPDGPIFQGFFENGSLQLSAKVTSPDYFGTGIGINSDGLLIVSANSSHDFYDQDGWLEYKSQPIFGMLQTERGYEIYADRPDLEDAQPVLLQLAQVSYSNDRRVIHGINSFGQNISIEDTSYLNSSAAASKELDRDAYNDAVEASPTDNPSDIDNVNSTSDALDGSETPSEQSSDKDLTAPKIAEPFTISTSTSSSEPVRYRWETTINWSS